MTTNFPTSDEGIRALRLTLLRALAGQPHPKQAIGAIAAKHDLTVDDVKSLVQSHGWPDPDAMGRSAAAIERNGMVTPRQPTAPTATARPTAVASSNSASVTVPASPTDTLLLAGEKSAKARTRRLAKRVREQLAELRGLVNTEKAEHEAAQRAAAEKEKLRAEVAELETLLARKKAALKPQRQAAAEAEASGVSAAEIRQWAAKHSVDCPAFGRIPADVREAYEMAAGGGS